MSQLETIEVIRTKLNEISGLLDSIYTEAMPESAYPTWLPMLNNDSPPDYFANYVSQDYWAANGVCTDIFAFKTASGFVGTTSLSDGLWCGPSKGNKLFHSNDFSLWHKAGVSTTTESGWQKITEATSTGAHECYKEVSFIPGNLHTLSGYFKAGTATKFRLWCTAAAVGFYVDVDLSTGTIGAPTSWGSSSSLNAGITVESDGVYRVWVSGVCWPTYRCYFDICILDEAGWQYTGTGRHIYAKECQFEMGSVSDYREAVDAPATLPTSQITRTITPPVAVTKRMKIKIAPQAASDYEVFYHLDNGQNNSNYADTELFRENTDLWIRTTHMNTVYRQGKLQVSNSDVVTVAWTTSTSGLLISFNGGPAYSLPGDTFNNGLTKERVNGNITGVRIANGSVLEDATWFVPVTAVELERLSA